MQAATLTDHKKLFLGTYWGCGGDALTTTEDIIANRNLFVRTWGIEALVRDHKLPHGYEHNLDHFEVYRAFGPRVVIVCSNYGGALPPPALGMTEIPPMYHPRAKTYAVGYASMLDAKHVLSSLLVQPWYPQNNQEETV